MRHNLRRGGVDPLPTVARSGPSPRRARGISGLACLLALAAAPAAALTVNVPDDWPTIQQAINSGASEVLVRPGVYPETLVVNRVIGIKGLVPFGMPPDSLPLVAGLVFADFVGEQIHNKYIDVLSLRFLSPVRNAFTWSPFWNPLSITLAGCALDSGLVDLYASGHGQIEYYLQRCTIGGPVRFVVPQQVHLWDCIVRAPITVATGLDYSTARRCDFKGPYPFAMDILSGDSFEITDCTFEGFETPIIYRSTSTVNVMRNRFVGPGIVPVALPDRGELAFHENRVTGFQYGIVVPGAWGDLEATRNVIEDCGTAVQADVRYGTFSLNEVRRCEKGVVLNVLDGLWATDNVVRSCGGDGMSLLGSWAQVERNSVGGCRGDGIRLTSDGRNGTDPSLVGNTVFRNGGAGLVLNVTGATRTGRVHHNIAYANEGHGLEFIGPGSVEISCNDWFGNAAGAVSGAEPWGDLALDPLFCDATQGDVRLSALSPLLNNVSCGQIGALGQGCDAPIVSRLATFTVAPTIGGIEVRWQVADTAPGFAAWLERAEAAGGPWAKVDGERASDGDVTVEYDRTAAPARSYWYRLVATDRGLTRVLGEPIRIETAPPTRFALLGTGPNPSPGTVEATFQLAHAAEITVELFDAQGRRVATLAQGSWPAGVHRATWSGARPAPGVYLVRYRHPGGEDLSRIAVVR